VLSKFTASNENRRTFSTDDITYNQDKLTVKLKFVASGIPFECNVSRGKKHEEDLKPNRTDILYPLQLATEQPLLLYFSTRRSILFNSQEPDLQMAAGNQSVAFVEALKPRMLRLQEFTAWWLVQKELADSGSLAAINRLEVLRNAVTTFLDWCTTLQVVRGRKTTLLVDKGGITFDIFQLSDGERGVLAVVLDLARRLAQANPGLDDPLKDGKAIVLIDELDLHLHPQWQRTVVKNLTETFPSCQFIATTHSPQIIGEVKPPGLHFLERRGNHIAVAQRGVQGYGLDTSWILEHFMGTSSRNPDIQEQIDLVENALEDGELEEAREQLNQLRSLINGDDNETFRLEASINNIEALAEDIAQEYEMDSEE
jgi:hypothetical protein